MLWRALRALARLLHFACAYFPLHKLETFKIRSQILPNKCNTSKIDAPVARQSQPASRIDLSFAEPIATTRRLGVCKCVYALRVQALDNHETGRRSLLVRTQLVRRKTLLSTSKTQNQLGLGLSSLLTKTQRHACLQQNREPFAAPRPAPQLVERETFTICSLILSENCSCGALLNSSTLSSVICGPVNSTMCMSIPCRTRARGGQCHHLNGLFHTLRCTSSQPLDVLRDLQFHPASEMVIVSVRIAVAPCGMTTSEHGCGSTRSSRQVHVFSHGVQPHHDGQPNPLIHDTPPETSDETAKDLIQLDLRLGEAEGIVHVAHHGPPRSLPLILSGMSISIGMPFVGVSLVFFFGRGSL